MAKCKSQESAAAHAGRALKYRWLLRLTTHVNKYTTAIPNMENVLWKMLWSTSRPVTYYEYINLNVLTYFDCPTIVLLDLIMGEHLTVLHYNPWGETKTTFINVYVSQQSQIQFEDEDHCCLHEFSLSNNYTVFIENHNLWHFDCTQCVSTVCLL